MWETNEEVSCLQRLPSKPRVIQSDALDSSLHQLLQNNVLSESTDIVSRVCGRMNENEVPELIPYSNILKVVS